MCLHIKAPLAIINPLSPPPLHPQLPRRCQLWGAALPLNSLQVPCILDPIGRVGVCGDWLLGASMQSAVLSGMALADQLAALRGKHAADAEQVAMGLRTPFVQLRNSDIGDFPTSADIQSEADVANSAAAVVA